MSSYYDIDDNLKLPYGSALGGYIPGVSSDSPKSFGPYKSRVPTVDAGTKTNDTPKGWFDINENGVSKFGSALGNVGTGVGIASGLAGMYYGRKQHKLAKQEAALKKDAYNRQVTRDNEAEKRMNRFAANAGNGAFYK